MSADESAAHDFRKERHVTNLDLELGDRPSSALDRLKSIPPSKLSWSEGLSILLLALVGEKGKIDHRVELLRYPRFFKVNE